MPKLVESLGLLDRTTSKARLQSGGNRNAPRAVASAARSTALALRILRRVPVAARTVVVPEGGRTTVKLPRSKWTRSLLRPGHRVTLVLRANAIVRGVTVTTTKRETLKLPRR